MQGKLDVQCGMTNFKGRLKNNNTALLQDLLTLTGKARNSFKIDGGLQDE